MCKFEDGTEERLEAPAPLLSRNPDLSYFHLECKTARPVKSLECAISLESADQAGQILLRQAAATVMLAEP